jgi:hypothetical protein
MKYISIVVLFVVFLGCLFQISLWRNWKRVELLDEQLLKYLQFDIAASLSI